MSWRLAAFPPEIKEIYAELRDLIFESTDDEVEEKLWAKMPSYYVGEAFVRLVPFADHINVQADSILDYKEELKRYKITPKGMLQIYLRQEVPVSVLERVFRETLSG